MNRCTFFEARGSAEITAQEFLRIFFLKKTNMIEFMCKNNGMFEFIDNFGVKYKMERIYLQNVEFFKIVWDRK